MQKLTPLRFVYVSRQPHSPLGIPGSRKWWHPASIGTSGSMVSVSQELRIYMRLYLVLWLNDMYSLELVLELILAQGVDHLSNWDLAVDLRDSLGTTSPFIPFPRTWAALLLPWYQGSPRYPAARFKFKQSPTSPTPKITKHHLTEMQESHQWQSKPDILRDHPEKP